jgi:hypothetical protein
VPGGIFEAGRSWKGVCWGKEGEALGAKRMVEAGAIVFLVRGVGWVDGMGAVLIPLEHD